MLRTTHDHSTYRTVTQAMVKTRDKRIRGIENGNALSVGHKELILIIDRECFRAPEFTRAFPFASYLEYERTALVIYQNHILRSLGNIDPASRIDNDVHYLRQNGRTLILVFPYLEIPVQAHCVSKKLRVASFGQLVVNFDDLLRKSERGA